MRPVYAWHFTEEPFTLRDGKHFKVGETLAHRGSVRICRWGYHASRRLLDACNYAPGPYLSMVRCSGAFQWEQDKFVCSRRKALWVFDVTPILALFIEQRHPYNPPRPTPVGAISAALTAACHDMPCYAYGDKVEQYNNELESMVVAAAHDAGLCDETGGML